MIKYLLMGFGVGFILTPFFGLPVFFAGIGYIMVILGLLYYFTFLV